MSHRIVLIEGDSVIDETVAAVHEHIAPGDKVLVALDSLHTRAHATAELERYAPLVTPSSYVVVFDGVMPCVADARTRARAGIRDNPYEAVQDFLRTHDEFEIDPRYNRLGATYCPAPAFCAAARPTRVHDVLRHSRRRPDARPGATCRGRHPLGPRPERRWSRGRLRQLDGRDPRGAAPVVLRRPRRVRLGRHAEAAIRRGDERLQDHVHPLGRAADGAPRGGPRGFPSGCSSAAPRRRSSTSRHDRPPRATSCTSPRSSAGPALRRDRRARHQSIVSRSPCAR